MINAGVSWYAWVLDKRYGPLLKILFHFPQKKIRKLIFIGWTHGFCGWHSGNKTNFLNKKTENKIMKYFFSILLFWISLCTFYENNRFLVFFFPFFFDRKHVSSTCLVKTVISPITGKSKEAINHHWSKTVGTVICMVLVSKTVIAII